MNPILFFTGYAELSADADHAALLLDAFLRHDLPFSGFTAEPDGGIRLVCSTRTANLLRREVPLTVLQKGGFPFAVKRLFRRPGLVVGGLCAIGLLLLSRLFVWDVRVTGNEQMSASEVLEELSGNGFGVGTYLPDFSAGELENRVLLTSDRLAWISVRMQGTVAMVQVMERNEKAPEAGKKPADLVAKSDGQIEVLELYRGNAVVRPGQAVRKGELLVSGIFEHENIGCRFTRAAGRVLARTEHTISIEIQLTDTEKVYYGTEKGAVWLNFFAFTGKISENSGNGTSDCDIIETVTHPDLWFLQNLPLSLRRETRRLWREQSVTRTQEEATELAYDRLEAELRQLSQAAQLLSCTTETVLRDGSVRLECTVLCIEDIAEQVEFDVTD